jgi:hypothetical protein
LRERMRDMVLKPLRMNGCGFGGAGTLAKIDQPWTWGPVAVLWPAVSTAQSAMKYFAVARMSPQLGLAIWQ